MEKNLYRAVLAAQFGLGVLSALLVLVSKESALVGIALLLALVPIAFHLQTRQIAAMVRSRVPRAESTASASVIDSALLNDQKEIRDRLRSLETTLSTTHHADLEATAHELRRESRMLRLGVAQLSEELRSRPSS